MLLDIIIPAPWWNSLIYNYNFNNNFEFKSGQRVRVPLGNKNGGRVGFISGFTSEETQKSIINKNIAVKDILELIDDEPVLDFGLWELALWLGRNFLCGTGMALKTICPNEILNGEKIDLNKKNYVKDGAEFRETVFFNPNEAERNAFYIEALKRPLYTLMLFPEVNFAKNFFKNLPENIKNNSILWPSTGGKKLWDAWRGVYSGNIKNVIAPPGGVFAPFSADCIIVEEEASEGYFSRRHPVFSARSVAGKRALDLKCELILGGSMPSPKTFLRNKIKCDFSPDRKNLIFVDIKRSLKINESGIDGDLPLTISLLERTRNELDAGNNVLWLLDRKGGAAEVFCDNCGHALKCKKCGGIMRSEDNGKILKCSRCAFKEFTPEKCPDCGGEILQGRRPGLEVLRSAAERLIKGHEIIMHENKNNKSALKAPALIIGTRGALALCGEYKINLVAWIDLDSELRRNDYNARFRVFYMVWQSCWRGNNDNERKILIQSRRTGRDFRDFFASGWEKFWREELELRKDLDLPPFGILIQFVTLNADKKARENFINELEDAGLLVMNLDLDLDNENNENNNDIKNTPDSTFWIETQSVGPVIKILAPHFDIANLKKLNNLNLKSITVCAE